MYNYNPYSYNPYAVQYNGNHTPAIPQPQPPVRNQSENNMLWVSGIDEVNNFLVSPNSAVTLWDKSGKTIYVKSADQTGLNKIKIYDLTERETPEKTPFNTADNFVSAEDFKALKGEFEKIKGIVDGLAVKDKPKEVVNNE